MPRLGVPSTTDSASRAHAMPMANRPPAAVDTSPHNVDLAALSPQTMSPALKARKRDERKAFQAPVGAQMQALKQGWRSCDCKLDCEPRRERMAWAGGREAFVFISF